MSSEAFDETVKVYKKHFSETTVEDCLRKAMDELKECLEAPKSKKLGELADVQICIWNALFKMGYRPYHLDTAVLYKDIVNYDREWVRLPDGTYQHVEGK